MLKTSYISLNDSGVLNKLLKDYINKKETLSPFFNFFPDENGFLRAISKNTYESLNRPVLFNALKTQADLVQNTSEKSLSNISLLQNKNTYTVTTGHQLCLNSGPLYFIYKIISVINLAEELKQKFPEKDFVPVYWMASEDHDFEEVSSFNLFGKQIKWNSTQTGAVGDFKTNELNELFPPVKETLGTSDNAAFLISLFEKSYLTNDNLANATRHFVNELFGQYGLVTVDGNDKLLKAEFKKQFSEDVFKNTGFKEVTSCINDLEKLGYSAQVNPRPINCFYIEPGIRGRIEQNGDRFNVLGTDISFSQKELEAIIENTPEKLSPNVVLRPVYQQVILPNISYTGGPGELAYWLQYKPMFDKLNAFFPVLTPRAFVTVVDKGLRTKMDKLGFTVAEFSADEQELIKRFQVKSNNVFDLEDEKKEIERVFSVIASKIEKIDKTLVNSVMAEQQKSINSLDQLSGKTNKALKQKSDTEINQIKSVKEKLFPTGIPQERYDNFAGFYLKWGAEFISALKQSLRPLNLEHHIVTEE